MTKGDFKLILRYRPANADENGDDDIFVMTYGGPPCDELLFNDEMELRFYPQSGSPLIPIDHWDDVKATLIYRGKLGAENDAVIGKVFKPGKVLFNEEWDDPSLEGSYDWLWTPDEDNDFYTAQTYVSGGKLVMQLDSKQYLAADLVQSSVIYDFTKDDPNGLLITENTVFESIVNEMSTSPSLNSSEAGHVMRLQFNHGPVYTDGSGNYFDYYRLMYIIDGPYITFLPPLPAVSDITAYLTIPPTVASGQDILGENIYDAFERHNITVPEPLYLRNIQFYQMAYTDRDEYHMRTVADYVRIVEMGDE